MTRPSIVCVKLILQGDVLFLDEYLLPNLHGIEECLGDGGWLLGRLSLAVVALEVRWPEELDERRTHCGGRLDG